MLKQLVARMIRSQEKATGESADYLRDLYTASPGGFWRFVMFLPMARQQGALPRPAAVAARIAAIHAEDCGPCLQTVVNMSLAAGASRELLAAAVAGDLDAMGHEARLAYEFADAIVHRDPRAEELRPEIEALWGKQGISELALAIASTRVFPTIKRTMGYAQACHRVTIGREVLDATLPPYKVVEA